MLGPQEIIQRLGLQPHPEGGYFRETYRSDELLSPASLPQRYGAPRRQSTAIYYLLTPDTCSMMHRVVSDELFHFYLGDPIEMLQIAPDGAAHVRLIGSDLERGCIPQLLVPRGWWQGSRVAEGGRFALLGATVSPGFEYADFELGTREEMLQLCPAQAARLIRLTPEPNAAAPSGK